MSESGAANPARYWLLGDRAVVMGQWRREIDHQVSRQPHLVSVSMRDGTLVAHNLGLQPTGKRDPTKVSTRRGGGEVGTD